jgi:hypothetical protein
MLMKRQQEIASDTLDVNETPAGNQCVTCYFLLVFH